MCDYASNERGYGCVYVCLSSSTKSVHVMEAILKVLIRGPPRDVRLCTRDQGWVWVCVSVFVCHFPSPVDSYVCICVCMYMYVKIAKRLRLHKAVILPLIMKYYVLKSLIQTRLNHATLSVSSLPTAPQKNHSLNIFTN